MKKLVDVFSILDAQSADPVPPEKAFYEGAIPGMLRRLDPHSVFFDPGQFQQLKELEKSTRKGFGTVVSLLPGRVIVLQVLPNTPSARAGLSPGDEILAVNNIALNRLDIEQLVQVLGQTRQRQARLDVRRPGNARLQQFMLTPEDVDAPAVDRVFELRPGIGYIRVTSFEAQTGQQVHDAIEKLGGNRLKGLVLDLRNNPGGILPAALETAAQFLQPKERILSVRGRKVQTQDIDVPDKVEPYTFPVAVLVNGKSASGSEIVAGALQDHKRADHRRRADLRQGPGAERLQSVARHGPGPDHSVLLHAERALDPAASGRCARRGNRHGRRNPEGRHPTGPVVYPEAPNRLRAALEVTGAFPSFRDRLHPVTPGDHGAMGRRLRGCSTNFGRCSRKRNIQPGIAEWSRELDWIRFRLKQEIYNQALGVAKGDEVEMAPDPQVQAAVAALGVE